MNDIYLNTFYLVILFANIPLLYRCGNYYVLIVLICAANVLGFFLEQLIFPRDSIFYISENIRVRSVYYLYVFIMNSALLAAIIYKDKISRLVFSVKYPIPNKRWLEEKAVIFFYGVTAFCCALVFLSYFTNTNAKKAWDLYDNYIKHFMSIGEITVFIAMSIRTLSAYYELKKEKAI